MTVRPVKTQISLGIHPVWSESSLFAQYVAKDSSFLHDQTGCKDTQADLSLQWANIPFCWVCHEAAHFYMSNCTILHNKEALPAT